MAMTAWVMAAILSGSVFATDATSTFPGPYFDSRVRDPLQRYVMASWPGPTELMRRWRESELSEEEKVVLLVGGAIHHDPAMLPAYREALQSGSQRLRRAAVYGFRDLLADRLPDVRVTIDDESAQLLDEEMYWVGRTLRRDSLLALWLQSALVQEGASLPGWQGVTMKRARQDCFRAAERLVDVDDLELLVTAFELSEDLENQIGLVRLIEALTLSQFIVYPKDSSVGWTSAIYTTAIESLRRDLRQWRRTGCRLDARMIVKDKLKAQGVTVADPFASDACGLWLTVLRRGDPRWWMLAARRLYACGGPWYELSALRPDTEDNRSRRGRLAGWYTPRQSRVPRPRHPSQR